MGSRAYGAYKYETDNPIRSYISLGPKNYSLIEDNGEGGDGKETVKIRGFTLTNEKILKNLNHTTMRESLQEALAGREKRIETEAFRMKADRKHLTVKNVKVKKTYKNLGFDKRMILKHSKDICTLPFGLKHDKFADLPNGLF